MPNNTTITNIAEKYIPIKSSDCHIIRSKKEWKRKQLISEITKLVNDASRETKTGI